MVKKAMNINPVSSYLEISKVVQFLERKKIDFNIEIGDTFITWVALCCSGISEKDLQGYKCRTNQYLQDALYVQQLPRFDSINDKKIKTQAFNKLCSAIGNHIYKQQDEISFKDAANHVAKITLDTLRQRGDIKGNDKHFSTFQKQKLSEEGYLIIPSVLNESEVEKLSNLTLFIAEQEDKAGVSYRYGGEDNKLQRVYNLISKHPAYIELLELPIIKEVLEHYFARDNLHHKYVLSSFQSNIIYPDGGEQQLHVDGWSFAGPPLPQWPTRLNVNFLLTDWTEDNGATLLAPGSHKLFRSPTPGEIKDSELLKIIAPKGSLVLWTGHIWHKSGTNNSSNPRFGLFSCFAASQLKEVSTEEEHLLVVDDEVKSGLSPEMRFMIGLDRGIKRGALHRVNFEGTQFDSLTLDNKINEIS
jgi:hypothetical protein